MTDMLIRLHNLSPDDSDAVERWLDEVLPTHEAIGEFTFSEDPPPGIQPDPIGELYQLASDGEAAMLDQLRRRAGQTWDCYGDDPDELKVCWTNGRPGHCENCGRPRPDSKSEAS